jgi:hypothetical protein
MREFLTAVGAMIAFTAVVAGAVTFLSYTDCENKAEMFGTQYKVISGGECYLKLDGNWVPEKFYSLAKSFKD